MSGTAAPITFDDLRRVVAGLPAEMKEADGGRVIGAANAVMVHFLGREWFVAHIRHDTGQPSFLRLDFSSDARREATVFRVVELAENLLNLQHVAGFDSCIAQMRAGAEKIESTCAELDVGRFLYIHDVEFRFTVPQLKKRADYDLEVIYPDGLAVPADTKCKFEATAINPESLRNSLIKARKQLPPNKAGIIFIKVPRRWIDDPGTARALINVAHDFFRNSGRVVSVKFYVSVLDTVNGMVLHRHAFRELTNQSSRFHGGRNWDLFAGSKVPASANGMPPKWQRLFFFPRS